MIKITGDQAYDYPATSKVLINCTECQLELERKISSIRHNLKQNQAFICHGCKLKSESYLNKQQVAHPKIGRKWGSKVAVKCTDCSAETEINYRSLAALKRASKTYRCLSCVNAETHANGSYDGLYTEEFKAKLKANGEQFWDQAREGWKARYENLDPAYRALMSECGKRAWRDQRCYNRFTNPIYKQLLSECGKRPWSDPEMRARLVAASLANWQNPDYQQRVVASTKLKWIDPDYRQRVIAGVKLACQDPEYRARMAVIRANQPRISSLQITLYKYLDDLGVTYHREGTETALGFYAFDCLVPGAAGRKHLLIECQGDYWHSRPETECRDRAKFTYIQKYFPEYELMYIWEHEFGAKDRVLDRLKQKLGFGLEPVPFRFQQVQLRTPEPGELKPFLDAYHYIGKDRGGRAIGAYLEGELIGCVVYSPPLRQNTAGQFGLGDGEVRELSRLCIHPAYHKKNFASWLIARTLPAGLTVAYCDTTVGHTGAVYKASGFRLHHEVPPDYWYVDQEGFVMHKRTLYGRARRMMMSEGQFAAEFGFSKRWGGKKLCFTVAR